MYSPDFYLPEGASVHRCTGAKKKKTAGSDDGSKPQEEAPPPSPSDDARDRGAWKRLHFCLLQRKAPDRLFFKVSSDVETGRSLSLNSSISFTSLFFSQ